jgi:diacylglycerol kinase (ATP)
MQTTSVMRRRTGLVIANPVAGSVSETLVTDLVEHCRRQELRVRVHWTRTRGDATSVAAAARTGERGRVDVVIAVGGDGTVREVVNGLLTGGPGKKAPELLIVPAGTGNSNYRSLWSDRPWPEMVAAALSGTGARVRHLDVARLAERNELVVLGACSGIVAEALYASKTVKLAGRERYRTAFQQAANGCKPYPGRVTVDGTVVHAGGTIFANVGGGRHRGGTYRLLPHSVLDDGLLDVCVVGDAVDPADVPELTRDGGHVSLPGVVYARGRRVTIDRTDGQPLWFEHDGELLAGVSSTFTLDVVPAALPVICDAAAPNG